MAGTFNIDTSMRNLKDYLRWEEVQKVINAARNDRDVLMIQTLAYTGRRISEVLQMTPRGILFDEEMGLFRILKKKKPTELMMPIHLNLLKNLKQYIQNNNIGMDDKLFPFTRIRAYQIIRRAGKEAGIEKIDRHFMHPHIFRHSFAIHYLRTSNDPAAMQKLKQLLAHSKIDTTSVYAQFAQKDLKGELDKM